MPNDSGPHLAPSSDEGDPNIAVSFDFLRVSLIALTGWWLHAESLDALVDVEAAAASLPSFGATGRKRPRS
jgi:hypothetical protein